MQHWLSREPWLERLALDVNSAWWNDWRFWRGVFVGCLAGAAVVTLVFTVASDAHILDLFD